MPITERVNKYIVIVQRVKTNELQQRITMHMSQSHKLNTLFFYKNKSKCAIKLSKKKKGKGMMVIGYKVMVTLGEGDDIQYKCL